MECDGTDLGSVQGLKPGSGEEFGSGLDVECAIGKPRVEKMDGKILVKKKRLNQIGTGYNSDDDEPIGSLFKLKSKRKPKKAKLDSGDKGKQVEVRPEKLVLKNEDLGCMEDTLASFKKKLKHPKKEAGSSLTAGRGMSNNAAELVGQSSNGPVEDAVLAAKSISNMVEKGLMTGEDVGRIVKKRSRKSPKENIGKSSKATSLLNNTLGVVEVVDVLPGERSSKKMSLDENECRINLVEKGLMTGDDVGGIVKKRSRKSAKEKSRRSKPTSLRNDTVGVVESVKVLHGERSGKKLSLDEQVCNVNLGVSSPPCSDEHLEDSLSSFFRKAQTGSVRKSHSSLRSKEVKKNQASNDELAHGPNIVGDDFPLLTVRKQSASKLGAKVSGSDGILHQVSHGGITDQTHHQNHILGHLKSDDRLSQGLKCREGGLALGDPTQQPSSAPVLVNKIFQASSRAHDGPSEGMLEDSVSVSSLEISQPRLKISPNKTRLVNRASAETHEGHPEEPPSTNHILDRGPDKFNCSKAREGCYVPTGGFVFSRDKHSKVVSAHAITTTEQKSSSPFRDGQGDSLGVAICSGIMKRISDKYSESPDPNLISNDENIRVSLKSLGEFGFDQCQNYFHHLQHSSPSSALRSPHKEVAPGHCDSPNRTWVDCNKDPDIVSVSSQKEDASVSDARLSPMSFGGHDKYESDIRVNHLGRSIDITDEEAPSSTPEQNETCTSDTNRESKDNMQQSGQRAVRNAKRHRHGDMAYEGDVDWEVLMQEPDFLVNHKTEDKDRPFRTKGKLNFLSTMSLEAESGGAAAVSAGLKARAVGPVEKIKFKEVLKRKGGLQEYIECRNYILYLWNKDVTRILPLSECGVSNIAAVDEPPRISLLRDIYAFLDHCGYINVGVASEKGTSVVGVKHNFRISEEKNLEGKSGVPLTDSDDGVSFILGSVKDCNSSMEEKGDALHNNEDKAAKGDTDTMSLDMQTQESSTTTKCKRISAGDYQERIGIDVRSPSKVVKLDVLGSTPCCHLRADGAVPVVLPGLRCSHSHEVQPTSTDYNETQHFPACDTERRNKIIVIGAGPAGLTAARHLHRQGFDVTVLEARSRIGGRVFTDCSSLSVPVDLGASIITGVEADVSTERRPDPSSLVCQQLGIELSVLNSDCPLYDISTGKKVPADLDESLEAEYNSLLDDTLLLVAQKGEHAMKMSLEEGLEYALKMRRMARSGKRFTGSERTSPEEDILSPLERRVMDWHFANLEYGCAASLKEVSLPYWNQDDAFGGFGGAHCMIKGGYSRVVDSLGKGLCIHLNHVVTDVCYHSEDHLINENQPRKVKVFTSNGKDFTGDAVLITVPLGCLKAETIKFSPQLPQWKYSSIQRLGFGVLNKVVLEFSEVFWDDSVDYFGATANETDQRGWCFMFWNVKKTVGAPVLIALVVGKAAINGQNINSSDHVDHAIAVLRKIFGDAAVPDPMASVVTDWGKDPFSYGAYSYVAVGASGEDYDILGRPINNCLFFAGEATCKEHPDTVGGAMMSGLREAVRIIEILNTGTDCTAEVEAMEAAQRHSDSERSEVRDIITRLDAIEISNVLYKSSLDGSQILTREALLQDMFSNAKTTAGRLHLVKELLNLPAEVLKSFTGTKEGLSILNSWILDSLGKDGTQLLRHCVRLLVRVSTDLLAVRLSGIGKTVKEKVCVHTSRDIRAIASQLVNVWVEIFRKEKASSGGLKLLRQSTGTETSKGRSNLASGKPPLRAHHASSDNRVPKGSAAAGNLLLANANNKKANVAPLKFESRTDLKSEIKPSKSQGSVGRHDCEEGADFPMSEEEQLAFAAAETARAAAIAAAEAYASSGAKCHTQLQLPKIPSFHKFARREQYAQMDDAEFKRKWAGGIVGRQDNISEIDSRNTRVRDWSVDFSATGVNIESSKMSGDNHSQRSHSNENACQLSYREHSGESAAVDSSIFTKAWVDSAGSEGIKDYTAIDRWQSQAAAADSDFFHRAMYTMDEEYSNVSSKPSMQKIDCLANESSASQVTINKELVGNQPRGSENIKQAVVDYVASLLMPLYKARKIDKEGYKSIMKKTATKVMEQTTDAEKAMAVFEFLDFKRKNKIRAFVDKLIERHMAMKDGVKC